MMMIVCNYSFRFDSFNDFLYLYISLDDRHFIHVLNKTNDTVSCDSMQNKVISLGSDYFFNSLFVFPIDEDIGCAYFHHLILIQT